jgi:hypothetical protein
MSSCYLAEERFKRFAKPSTRSVGMDPRRSARSDLLDIIVGRIPLLDSATSIMSLSLLYMVGRGSARLTRSISGA